MFPNWEFKEVFKLRKPDIDKNICEEISYHGTCLTYGELVDTINGIYSEARNVQKENRALKQSDNITDLETQIMKLKEENQSLKKELFEAKSECLWVTSDEVDRALYYEDEIEELRKEIFE